MHVFPPDTMTYGILLALALVGLSTNTNTAPPVTTTDTEPANTAPPMTTTDTEPTCTSAEAAGDKYVRKREVDVVVIGAGPGGISAAHVLRSVSTPTYQHFKIVLAQGGCPFKTLLSISRTMHVQPRVFTYFIFCLFGGIILV